MCTHRLYSDLQFATLASSTHPISRCCEQCCAQVVRLTESHRLPRVVCAAQEPHVSRGFKQPAERTDPSFALRHRVPRWRQEQQLQLPVAQAGVLRNSKLRECAAATVPKELDGRVLPAVVLDLDCCDLTSCLFIVVSMHHRLFVINVRSCS